MTGLCGLGVLCTGKGRGCLSALEPRGAEGYTGWGQKQAETKTWKAWIWDFISSPLRSHWSADFGHISRAFVGISEASPCGVECGCSQKQRDLRATDCLSREGWTAVAEVKEVTGEKRLVI